MIESGNLCFFIGLGVRPPLREKPSIYTLLLPASCLSHGPRFHIEMRAYSLFSILHQQAPLFRGGRERGRERHLVQFLHRSGFYHLIYLLVVCIILWGASRKVYKASALEDLSPTYEKVYKGVRHSILVAGICWYVSVQNQIVHI